MEVIVVEFTQEEVNAFNLIIDTALRAAGMNALDSVNKVRAKLAEGKQMVITPHSPPLAAPAPKCPNVLSRKETRYYKRVGENTELYKQGDTITVTSCFIPDFEQYSNPDWEQVTKSEYEAQQNNA